MFGNSIYAVYGKMLNVLSLPDYFLMEFNLSTCVISFLFFFLFFFFGKLQNIFVLEYNCFVYVIM